MRKCVLIAALIAACIPSVAAAQSSTPSRPSTQTGSPYPEPAKWFGHIHVGAQAGSQDLSRTTEFSLYDETARFEASQKAKGGALFDVGGAARLYQNYGVGLSYAQFSSSSDGTFSGSLPHPLFFDQPRGFSGAAPADHKERAVHLQALWFIPFTDKVDFTVGVGPSFFTVEQDFVRGIAFSENPPDFNQVTIDSTDVARVKESGVGFNLGGTVSYAITRHIGASGMIRYARGSLTFNLGNGQSVDSEAGGFQIGVGVGVRY